MQETNRSNTGITSTSRSSTLVNRSVSIDSLDTVVPSLFGPETVADPENAEIDIWFVHGLTGNRRRTWTHETTNVFWPELLAIDFPKARIISYGYDANVLKFAKDWGNASTESLESYGLGLALTVRDELIKLHSKTPRPIYFVAHSLGGLVVEQALLESIRADRSLENVALWTAGILFFGVPHQGSHLAKWGSALRKMIPQSFRSTNKKVIDVLKTDSEVCEKLEGDFQKEAKHGKLKKIRLFSFYETQKLPGFSNLVVPEKSAVLKADFKCAIEGHHKSMTRFTGPNDPEYCKVKGQLTYWLLPENVSQIDVPIKKKKNRARISVQGASITGGTFSGPVNAGTTFAKRDLFVTQGPNSTQQFFQSGGRSDQNSSDEYGEPSSGSDSDSDEVDDEHDVEEIEYVDH